MMHMQSRRMMAFLLLAWGTCRLAGAEPATGWRGNGTGLWPDARPPLEWRRIPRGALDGMRAAASRSRNADTGDAAIVVKGLVRDWLVLGPFTLDDSLRDFDRDLLGGEDKVEPLAGAKLADHVWTPTTVPPDDIMVFGTAELPWLDLAKAVGFKRNQIAYAHTYLHSPRGGAARIVVDHGHGLKAWLNGKVVYRSPNRGIGLGYYTQISAHELRHLDQPSPSFDITLQRGWNRLLLKISTANQDGYKDMRCSLRIMDPPDVKYETKNIVWMTPLPGRSTSTPIQVGDRLFVTAEPDELLCIDKRDGKILWTRAINYYEAMTPQERQATPAYAASVAPLLARLGKESDRRARTRLRAEIQKTLLAIDSKRFSLAGSGHFESHFGIVGFTMPTPVSDGQRVFIWNGMGIAACFDLEGNRQWITRVETDEINYGSSPALADGVLAVFQNAVYGLEAKSGKVLWQQKKIKYNVAAILGSTFAGKQVFVTQRGDVLRPADGAILFRPEGAVASGDTGWAPPVLLGNLMYLPKYGVGNLSIIDFSGARGDTFKPKLVKQIALPEDISRGPNGKWIDRWTAGSPLIWDGLAYLTDIYQRLYVVDLKTGKLHYRRDLELEGFTHYNAVAVAASNTLIGKHVLISDNQGTTLVLEPGPAYKVAARNRIATVLERRWPLPSQETLCYAPALADGGRLYLRGESYLYCIGAR